MRIEGFCDAGPVRILFFPCRVRCGLLLLPPLSGVTRAANASVAPSRAGGGFRCLDVASPSSGKLCFFFLAIHSVFFFGSAERVNWGHVFIAFRFQTSLRFESVPMLACFGSTLGAAPAPKASAR